MILVHKNTRAVSNVRNVMFFEKNVVAVIDTFRLTHDEDKVLRHVPSCEEVVLTPGNYEQGYDYFQIVDQCGSCVIQDKDYKLFLR
jgi:hypothetical protein